MQEAYSVKISFAFNPPHPPTKTVALLQFKAYSILHFDLYIND